MKIVEKKIGSRTFLVLGTGVALPVDRIIAVDFEEDRVVIKLRDPNDEYGYCEPDNMRSLRDYFQPQEQT